MFKTVLTLFRGGIAVAEEQLEDRTALVILDQQMRDAESALARAQTSAPDATDRPDPDDDSARAWAAAARSAFLGGYRAATGASPQGALLDALELDKAVYEAIYEARHRPDWLQIPLSAVARLSAR